MEQTLSSLCSQQQLKADNFYACPHIQKALGQFKELSKAMLVEGVVYFPCEECGRIYAINTGVTPIKPLNCIMLGPDLIYRIVYTYTINSMPFIVQTPAGQALTGKLKAVDEVEYLLHKEAEEGLRKAMGMYASGVPFEHSVEPD